MKNAGEEQRVQVLIVEDCDHDADLCAKMLSMAEITATCHVARMKSELIEVIRGEAIDCIICNYALGTWTAPDAIAAARFEGFTGPIIVVSGNIGEEASAQCMKLGASDFLLKEHLDRLPTIVHYALELRQVNNERQRAQEELQISAERFRALVEHECDGIEIIDDAGSIIYASPSASTVTGYAADELLGRPAFAIIHPDDRAKVQKAFADCVRSRPEAEISVEFRIVRKDGTDADIEAVGVNHLRNSAIGGVVVNFRDITQRKRSAAALAESERQFRAMFDTAMDAVAIADDLGRYVDANPATCQLLGLAREDLLGQSIQEFMVEGNSFSSAWDEFRGSGGKRGECRLRRADGSELTAEYSATYNFVPGKHLFIMRDVTLTRAVEEQLRNACKFEAVGRLAGGIAHEFNNMLMVISSYAELLTRNAAPEAAGKVNAILRAASKAGALTQQLLAFSRKQVMSAEILRLDEVLETSAMLLKRILGDDIRLVFQTEPELRAVRTDRAQIEQVLVNLAVNARDAMPTGGMLSISTSNCLLTGHERLPGKPEPGRYVLMEICDTGAGIAPEVRPHVFEPFFTTKPRAQATGLGLSTVYGIVKQSDGFIYVESESQQGAKFSIYLPAAEDPKRPAANNTVDIVELLRK